jgi:hypothetical protein
MAASSSPAESLSARFEEWFKSQPEAQTHTLQALEGTHSYQSPGIATGSGVKGPNDRVTPILYDFDSKYAIETLDPFTDGEVSGCSSVSNSAAAGRLDRTKDVHVNDLNSKARQVLGLDQPVTAPPKVIISLTECSSPSPSSPTRKPSIQPVIRPPAPEIFLLPNKKPWTKTHIRTLIILSLILQAGIIALTVSIVLCTQATKSGRTTDGSIITGVIGCASIICGLITGYDMLIAEYAPSQHSHHRRHTSEQDIEKGIRPHTSTPKTAHTFNSKHLSIDTHAANARYHITHHQLPHNVIYNSRLSNPFSHIKPLVSPTATSLASPYATSLASPYATSLASPYATSLTSPYANTLTSPRARTARRLTPHSPLPYSPTLGSIVPSPTSSVAPKNTAPPESWAQRLEVRVRPLSKLSARSRLSTLKEEEDEGLAAEKHGSLIEGEKQGKEARDSTTSRILSLYSSFGPYKDVWKSLPVSPVAASVYELPAYGTPVSTPRRSSFFRGSGLMGKGQVGRRGSVEGVWGRFAPQEEEGGRKGRVSWA